MSGPWDRPSSPNPDDQDWPAEDVGASTPSTPPADPWSSDDPWQQQPSDATPSWDVWPSPAPPPDDYVVDEPMRPSSDPWAETWTDDDVPEPSSATPPQDEPLAPDRPAPADEPRIAPWAADDDPWAASESSWTPAEPWRQEPTPAPAPEPEQAPDAGSAYEPGAEDPVAEQAEPVEAAAPVEAVEPPAPPPFTRPSWPPPFLEREDEPADVPADKPEPDGATAPEDEPETESGMAPMPEPAGEPEAELASEAEPEPGREPDMQARPDAEAEAGDEPEPAAGAAEEIEADAPEEAGVNVDGSSDVPEQPTIEPDALPAMVDRVESAPAPVEPMWEPDLWAEEAEPDAEVAEQVADRAEDRVDAPTDASDADVAAESHLDEPAAEAPADDEVAGEPEDAAPSWQPTFAGAGVPAEPSAPAQLDDDQDLDDGPDEDLADEAEPWPVRGEPTQVFPTSWTPPPPPARERIGGLDPEAGTVRTSLSGATATDDELEATPTTAEQAVPWLIGVILLLAGMVIVLLALIFAGDASLGGAAGLPSESIDEMAASMSAAPSVAASPAGSPVPSTSTAPTPTPAPAAQYGALEVIYQGRSAALAPIYLLDQDFTTADGPSILAQDATLDVRRFAWSPDGTVGAALLADVLVSIEPGTEKRRLGEDISTLTFGSDASTVYAVRVTEDGENDVAAVLAIDFLSGDTTEIASATYARPDIGQEDALAEAQFADDGGTVRIYWTEDDQLVLWSIGAGAWSIDPESGELSELASDVPVLWSPNGERRIVLTLTDGTTTIALHEGDSEQPAATTALDGRVSHVRWSPTGDRVIFTLGRLASGGGILQDLMLWDLDDGVTPMRLTSSGAAFGVEWRGGQPLWRVD